MMAPEEGPKIGFVTSADFPDLAPDDIFAAQALASAGYRVVPAIWNNRHVNWKEFQIIIIRSCWDYHKHPSRFREWIGEMERSALPVWNPTDILRWNMEKSYLLDLQAKNIEIPRTILLNPNDEFEPAAIARSLSDSVVIKPAISASAWKTWKLAPGKFGTDDVNKLNQLRDHSAIVVQEFMPEIESAGEWSFIFFGEFSHAVRKVPASGDFRVQEEHGGTAVPEQSPPHGLLRQAERILASIGREVLYARIDAVERAGRLILMELELIEPQLYFEYSEAGVQRFVRRVSGLLK